MTKIDKDLPASIRFCIIEILTAYQESKPQHRPLQSSQEGFLFIHNNFVRLENHLSKLGTSTTHARQRQAAASLAAAALRILTDLSAEKECEPCQKKALTPSVPTKPSDS